MSKLPKRNAAQLNLSALTIQLRVQVERLEFARRTAIATRDFKSVEAIDEQMSQATREWAKSFATDQEEKFRKIA
jgi:hypothetical protein